LNLWVPNYDPRPFGHQSSSTIMKAEEWWWSKASCEGLCWSWEMFFPYHRQDQSECVLAWWVNQEEKAKWMESWLNHCFRPLETGDSSKKRL